MLEQVDVSVPVVPPFRKVGPSPLLLLVLDALEDRLSSKAQTCLGRILDEELLIWSIFTILLGVSLRAQNLFLDIRT